MHEPLRSALKLLVYVRVGPYAPEQVLDTPTIKAWHLLDVSMGAPRAAVFLSLNSPLANESPRAAALLRLLLEVD